MDSSFEIRLSTSLALVAPPADFCWFWLVPITCNVHLLGVVELFIPNPFVHSPNSVCPLALSPWSVSSALAPFCVWTPPCTDDVDLLGVVELFEPVFLVTWYSFTFL